MSSTRFLRPAAEFTWVWPVLAALLLHARGAAADQTATWNGTSGNWSDAARWNTNPLFPNNGNGGLTFDAVQNAGIVAVDQTISIEKLTMSGGTNSGAGLTLTMNDLFTWTGGLLNGAGTMQANGGVALSGTATKSINTDRVLSLGADSTWSAGTLRLGFSGVLATEAGVTLVNSFDGTMENAFGGTGVFNNAGTFTKSAGTGTTTISAGVAFNNSGTVNVNSGALSLNNAGTHTGAFNSGAGAATYFNSGVHAFNTGASFSGAGTTAVSGATIQVNAPVSVGSAFLMSGGIRSGAGTLTITGPATFSGGTLSGAATTQADGGVTFSGTAIKSINTNHVLNLGADSTWSAGEIRIGNSSVLATEAGVTLVNSFDGTLNNPFGGTGVFNNAGTFTKSAGTGTTTISAGVAFNNSGTVNVNSGALSLNNAGTHTGAFNSGAGAATYFNSGVHAFNTGASFSGAGTTAVSGATFQVNASVSVGSAFQIFSGIRSGAGTLTITGPATFAGGDFNGAATTQADGGVTFNGASAKFINNSHVLNLGADSTWSAGEIRIGNSSVLATEAGVTLVNNFDGTLRNTLGGTSTFNNAGTFTKSAGTGTTSIAAAVTFNNTGTVNVNTGTLTLSGGVTQHSGTSLTGGAWNVSSGATVNITTGSNITTIGSAANVTLDGTGANFARINTLTTNQGGFTLKNNRDFTTTGAFANSGTVSVQDGTTAMTIGTGGASAYTQTGASSFTILAGGAMIDTSAFNLNGGTLQGIGTIDGPLTATSGNATTIAPGASPGTITINGSTILGANNTLAIELGGLVAGTDHDQLVVNGVLTLGGLLGIDFINLFETTMHTGDVFTLATSTSDVQGSFSNVANGGTITDPGHPLHLFSVHYGAGSLFNPNNVVLLALTPEPGRAVLLMSGLMGAFLRRRRKV